MLKLLMNHLYPILVSQTTRIASTRLARYIETTELATTFL